MALSVGFIGVGNMGNPMAGNVLKAGFPLTVFDRSAKAMENLVQAGARAAASVDEVAKSSEIPSASRRMISVAAALGAQPSSTSARIARRRSMAAASYIR